MFFFAIESIRDYHVYVQDTRLNGTALLKATFLGGFSLDPSTKTKYVHIEPFKDDLTYKKCVLVPNYPGYH